MSDHNYTKEQYHKALPWLNVLSKNPWSKRMMELERKIRILDDQRLAKFLRKVRQKKIGFG